MHDDVRPHLLAGESADVEFKTTLSDSRKIIETVAAMATIGGGVILVGVRPDGRPVGVEPGEGEIERFVQQVLANTDPRVYVDLDRPEVDGQKLLRIRVPPADGPNLAFGRAFYRSGPATVAMTRDEYERRLLDRLRESSGFERRTDCGVGMNEIDAGALERFVERARSRGLDVGSRSPEDVLRRLHLLRGDQLTVAGILLFAREPQGALPQATLRALARRGASEDAQAIEGTLDEQIERAVLFVTRNLKVRAVRTGTTREERPELPAAAVREVVANAVAHRAYQSTAPIQLRLDDRGLSIWNPGHFPPPITPALLRQEHPSVPPNPLIARALYLAGYIEEWGTGTLRIIETMRASGNPEPVFTEESHTGVRVVLPLPGALPPDLTPRQAAFLEKQPATTPFSTAEYAAANGLAPRTALLDLVQMEALGLVGRTGRGKSTRWIRL